MLEPADQTALENLYSGVAVDDPTLAASTALHFILDSPRFLFTVEFGTPEATLSRLSLSEVAGRLARLPLAQRAGRGAARCRRRRRTRRRSGRSRASDAPVPGSSGVPVLKARSSGSGSCLGSTGTDATAHGIMPDVVVEATYADDPGYSVLREADLENHLPAERQAAASQAASKPPVPTTRNVEQSGVSPTHFGVARVVPFDPTNGPDVALSIGYQLVRGVLDKAKNLPKRP